ncbi:hypothetical protein BsWGS_28543 [Bradybaena similaris]
MIHKVNITNYQYLSPVIQTPSQIIDDIVKIGTEIEPLIIALIDKFVPHTGTRDLQENWFLDLVKGVAQAVDYAATAVELLVPEAGVAWEVAEVVAPAVEASAEIQEKIEDENHGATIVGRDLQENWFLDLVKGVAQAVDYAATAVELLVPEAGVAWEVAEVVAPAVEASAEIQEKIEDENHGATIVGRDLQENWFLDLVKGVAQAVDYAATAVELLVPEAGVAWEVAEVVAPAVEASAEIQEKIEDENHGATIVGRDLQENWFLDLVKGVAQAVDYAATAVELLVPEAGVAWEVAEVVAPAVEASAEIQEKIEDENHGATIVGRDLEENWFDDIVEGIEEVASEVGEIAEAAGEAFPGIAEIADSVALGAKITEAGAAVVDNIVGKDLQENWFDDIVEGIEDVASEVGEIAEAAGEAFPGIAEIADSVALGAKITEAGAAVVDNIVGKDLEENWFDDIVEGIEDVASEVGEIAEAAGEAFPGIAEIADSVALGAKITEAGAAVVDNIVGKDLQENWFDDIAEGVEVVASEVVDHAPEIAETAPEVAEAALAAGEAFPPIAPIAGAVALGSAVVGLGAEILDIITGRDVSAFFVMF